MSLEQLPAGPTPEGTNYIGQVTAEMGAAATDDVGTLSGLGDYMLGDNSGRATVALALAGTWVATVAFEGMAGNSGSWVAISAINLATGALVQSATANGTFLIPFNGLTNVRANVSAYTSGTIEFHMGQVYDPTLVRLSASLPAGTNAIGKLAANSGVDIGDVDVTSLPAITGTVTANAGTNLNTSALALETTLGTTNTELGATNESAAATDTSTSGLNGLAKRIAQRLTSAITLLAGGLPAALGAGGGLKVDGSGTALPVTANAGTNLNTSSLALETTQTAQATLIGAVTETAPATDTASSGLNGRLQRIAQRVTSLIALVPAALGQGTMAQSFRVVVASDQSALTVASHAVTNAGTFATQVDGAALTSLQLLDDTILADDAAFTPASSKVSMAGFEFDDAAPDSVDEGDAGAARMSANRNQYVQLRDAAGNERGVNVNASNQLAVTGPVTNAGTFAVQVDGSALTALQLIDDPVIADDAAFTPATSKVMMAGFQADETATDSVDEGDAGAARMTLDRKTIVTPQPHAAGGLSIFRSIDLDEGTLEVAKNSAGCVYGMWVTNTATTTRWIKFYDAASGTLGTGTPVITIGIPGNTSDDIAGNFGPGGMGITFATGICVGASTGVADNDTGAPGANDVIIDVFYK